MYSAIKHMQITTKVDQISEGNISMQSTSQVLKKMSSRAQRPPAQKGIEHILKANTFLSLCITGRETVGGRCSS